MYLKSCIRSAVLILLMSCHWHRDWAEAPQFQAHLRSGMTVDEVRKLAKELGAAEFEAPTLAGNPGIPDYYAAKNERLISLWFEAGRLTGYLSGPRSCMR